MKQCTTAQQKPQDEYVTNFIHNIAANALRAAAVRGLLDFIFAIRSHVHRPGITLPTICPRIAAARLLCMV
jgi:hypothetical protein